MAKLECASPITLPNPPRCQRGQSRHSRELRRQQRRCRQDGRLQSGEANQPQHEKEDHSSQRARQNRTTQIAPTMPSRRAPAPSSRNRKRIGKGDIRRLGQGGRRTSSENGPALAGGAKNRVHRGAPDNPGAPARGTYLSSRVAIKSSDHPTVSLGKAGQRLHLLTSGSQQAQRPADQSKIARQQRKSSIAARSRGIDAWRLPPMAPAPVPTTRRVAASPVRCYLGPAPPPPSDLTGDPASPALAWKQFDLVLEKHRERRSQPARRIASPGAGPAIGQAAGGDEETTSTTGREKGE